MLRNLKSLRNDSMLTWTGFKTHAMPIRRTIFNTLTVVSLVLMLATVGLWVDSGVSNG